MGLSFTHLFISVAIVLLSLPLVNIMFGGNGAGIVTRSRKFQPRSARPDRCLDDLAGLVAPGHAHHEREGIAVGVMAGLITCSLTLFILNFAVLHQVVFVGLLFVVSMMAGIALTLRTVAVGAVLFRNRITHLNRDEHRARRQSTLFSGPLHPLSNEISIHAVLQRQPRD
jgi:hypothetical protein